MKRNPFAPEVPCHRVVKSDLSIGGFWGQVKGEEIEKKIRMLEEEGVTFHDEEHLLIDESCVHHF
jgi:methylated-DNA-[protein]-cysteine S-methyltransferase